MTPTSSSSASRSGKPGFARILGALRGRYRLTMLGGWSTEGIDSFQLLIGTILSARCRDEVTEVVSRNLFERYPTPEKLAAARPADVQRIIKSIGYYRMKAKYVIETAKAVLRDHAGKVPMTIEELTAFPGVGRKVANCVLVYAFERPAIPVDTHVHRVSNRLGWVTTKAPEQTERELTSILPRRHWLEVNELFVAHGKATCRPVRPQCHLCPIREECPTGALQSRPRCGPRHEPETRRRWSPGSPSNSRPPGFPRTARKRR